MALVRRVLVLVLAALALGACKVDTRVDVAVRPDGTGSITLTAVADADLVKKAPGLAEDLRFDDVKKAGWTVDGPTTTADGGLQVVVSHAFATVEEGTALLASLNGPDGPLHGVALARTVTADAITTTLKGTVGVSNGLDAFADPDVLAAIGGSPYAKDLAASGQRPADVVTFTFTADLPGAASNSTAAPATAAAAGAPMRWSVPLDGTSTDLSTTAVLAQGGRGSSTWSTVATVSLIALVAWLVVAVVFIAFVAKARRDRALRRLVR
jgi:hypothetical protein